MGLPSARTPALRHNEGAPLSTSSLSCNSTALAPQTFVPVHDLPSRSVCSNGGCYPTAQEPFRSFPCAHSAVRGGFCPMFLLCCALANPRLYNTQPHDVTELKLCNCSRFFMHFFRKVTYFVKNAAKPVLPRLCCVRFLGYFVLKLIIDFFGGVLYTVTKPFFDMFRKVRNFAKFFYGKGRPPASFCGIPCAADWPTNDSSGGA